MLKDSARRNLVNRFLFDISSIFRIVVGKNTVSQREIQRCFSLTEYFYQRDDAREKTKLDRCIALSLALIYYFRLPTDEDNKKRGDTKTPSREELAKLLSISLPRFPIIVQQELESFVSTKNFIIPSGVAINQAVCKLPTHCH